MSFGMARYGRAGTDCGITTIWKRQFPAPISSYCLQVKRKPSRFAFGEWCRDRIDAGSVVESHAAGFVVHGARELEADQLEHRAPLVVDVVIAKRILLLKILLAFSSV